MILVVGFGGGIGIGVMLVIVDIVKKMGILIIVVLIMFFDMEGEIKKSIVLFGISEIKNYVNFYLLVLN